MHQPYISYIVKIFLIQKKYSNINMDDKYHDSPVHTVQEQKYLLSGFIEYVARSSVIKHRYLQLLQQRSNTWNSDEEIYMDMQFAFNQSAEHGSPECMVIPFINAIHIRECPLTNVVDILMIHQMGSIVQWERPHCLCIECRDTVSFTVLADHVPQVCQYVLAIIQQHKRITVHHELSCVTHAYPTHLLWIGDVSILTG